MSAHWTEYIGLLRLSRTWYVGLAGLCYRKHEYNVGLRDYKIKIVEWRVWAFSAQIRYFYHLFVAAKPLKCHKCHKRNAHGARSKKWQQIHNQSVDSNLHLVHASILGMEHACNVFRFRSFEWVNVLKINYHSFVDIRSSSRRLCSVHFGVCKFCNWKWTDDNGGKTSISGQTLDRFNTIGPRTFGKEKHVFLLLEMKIGSNQWLRLQTECQLDWKPYFTNFERIESDRLSGAWAYGAFRHVISAEAIASNRCPRNTLTAM